MVDFGTGDGSFVVATATADPATLAVGVDADLAGLGAGFERARRRGVGNALFVVASAEAPPAELRGVADRLVIQYPWGSLRDVILEADDRLRALASLIAPNGRLTVLLSIVARDHVASMSELDEGGAREVARRVAERCALSVDAVAPVAHDDVRKGSSTWAKRLGVGRSRSGYRLELRRVVAEDDPPPFTPAASVS